MRRTLAVIVAMLLLTPEASAQVAVGQLARIAPTQTEMEALASLDTSYLLASYMTQLAAAGSAPSQADIDEAARQYFTNGAAVASVPSSGPGAAYFTDGAAVTGVPSIGPGAAYFHNGAGVMAYYAAPPVPPAPETTGEAVAPSVGSKSPEEHAGAQRVTASADEAAPMDVPAAQPEPTSEVRSTGGTPTGLTCSPVEIETAMAIARQYATAATSPLSAVPRGPATASTPILPVERAPTVATEPAPNCPPGLPPGPPEPTFLSRTAMLVSGAFLGGLAAALWRRSRPLREAQRC
jgi:hypothetical protein